ncbi:ATP-binding protein [Streptomyces pathocidini]|uniref:ATP-binding protein n=1 Tax=Streptomyces pathocidini TaxID=1650571 RepID=UPI003F4D6709
MERIPVPLTRASATWRAALPHTAAAVPIARALIRNALAELERPVDCDTAELLTAELVANAVEHTAGTGPIELVVELLGGHCQVEVHDRDPVLPADMAHAESNPYDLDERGRGLLLIRTLSSASGYRTTPHGKAVWFTLPSIPPQPRRG